MPRVTDRAALAPGLGPTPGRDAADAGGSPPWEAGPGGGGAGLITAQRGTFKLPRAPERRALAVPRGRRHRLFPLWAAPVNEPGAGREQLLSQGSKTARRDTLPFKGRFPKQANVTERKRNPQSELY